MQLGQGACTGRWSVGRGWRSRGSPARWRRRLDRRRLPRRWRRFDRRRLPWRWWWRLRGRWLRGRRRHRLSHHRPRLATREQLSLNLPQASVEILQPVVNIAARRRHRACERIARPSGEPVVCRGARSAETRWRPPARRMHFSVMALPRVSRLQAAFGGLALLGFFWLALMVTRPHEAGQTNVLGALEKPASAPVMRVGPGRVDSTVRLAATRWVCGSARTLRPGPRSFISLSAEAARQSPART